jgi:transcriptional regulator with XRE-family HTH domain
MRASTTQSAISRIERDGVSPSVETLGELLHLLGEDLTLGAKERDFGIDWTLNEERLKLSPSERVAYGLVMAAQMIAISPNVRTESA